MSDATGYAAMIAMLLAGLIALSLGGGLPIPTEARLWLRRQRLALARWWGAMAGDLARPVALMRRWARSTSGGVAAFVPGSTPQPKVSAEPTTSVHPSRGKAGDDELTIDFAGLPRWYQPGTAKAAPRVGRAADGPPAGLEPLLECLNWMDRQQGADPYRFPIGWQQLPDGGLRLLTGTYGTTGSRVTRHGMTTGQTAAGKGGYALQKILALMSRTTPEQYQVLILDGKRLDFHVYRGLAHIWGLANSIEEFPPLLARLDAERERRQRLLNEARKKNWHSYVAMPGAEPLPLLHVYVAELALLEAHMGKNLWVWLNDHLTTARAFGFVFDVDLQTASNTPTLWRRQIQLFLAGYQPSPDDDRPCTGLQAEQILARGAVPPSQLPGQPGYFCMVHGRAAVNVRTSYVSEEDEQVVLDRLPRTANPEPAPPLPAADLARQVSIARRLIETQGVSPEAALTMMGVHDVQERAGLIVRISSEERPT